MNKTAVYEWKTQTPTDLLFRIVDGCSVNPLNSRCRYVYAIAYKKMLFYSYLTISFFNLFMIRFSSLDM